MSAKEIKRRADRLFSKRDDLSSLWQVLGDIFYPERATFTTSRSWGEEFASHLFDGTTVTMRRDLGNAFASMLRPRGQEWFRLTLTDRELAAKPGVADWLDNAGATMRRILYNRRSQFVRATKTADHDFATFGNAVLSCEVNNSNDGLLYRCWHLADCVWTEDADGVVNALWRRMKLPARQIVAIFGDRAHQDVRNCLDKDPDKEFNILHCMLPSDEYGEKKFGMPWTSVYIDCDHEITLRDAGSQEFRYVVPRWQPISGSPYGVSPAAMTALPDGRMLQRMALSMIEAAEKAIDPPLIATEEAIRGEVNLHAQGITWVDREYDEKLGAAIQPMYLGKDVNIAAATLEGLRMSLADAWYLNKLSLPQRQAKTAFETAQLVEEFIRAAIPIFEPMETEYNVPLLEMTADTLMRIGVLGGAPNELKGGEIEFEFSNPLQDAIEKNKVNQFETALAIVGAASQIDPGASSVLDVVKGAREAIEGSGAPADWLLDEKQAGQGAEEARTLSMAATGAQIAKPAADAMAKMAEVPNAA